MSVIADAVASWKLRLEQIEDEIAPLLAEAEELRRGIRRLESRSAPRDGAASNGASGEPRPSRSPRGENRRQVLAAIATEAKTAGEIAAETGLHRASIATLLIKLVDEGVAVKASRGYRAANGAAPGSDE
jgi:predicted Rossmann fold nucleotide-binding protein DprA/Smf involved in DNA uptake